MDTKKMKAVIEAILFTMGDSVEISKLCTALDTDKKTIRSLVRELQEEYEARESGLKIIEIEDSYQMCTKEFAYESLIKIVSIPKSYRLTDIQLETLSIIAYKQPITKIEVEKIRGVMSDKAINRLIEAGLVEEKGRLNTPGRPIILGTTEEFLRRFGLSNYDELPNIQAEQVETFKIEAEEELGYHPEVVHDEMEDVEGQISLDLPQEKKEEFEQFDDEEPVDPEEIIDVGV